MTTIKTDLLTYGGTLGLQAGWRFVQGNFGNFAKRFSSECENKEIKLISIASMNEAGITKGSIHDRFNQFKESAGQAYPGYRVENVGENTLLTTSPSGYSFYVLNAQGVITYDLGRRRDFWAIGTNSIKNGLPLENALKESQERNLVIIGDEKGLFGKTCEQIGDLEKYFDAYLSNPGEQTRSRNYVNSSKAHSMAEIGMPYAEFSNLDLNSEASILNSLKKSLRNGEFRNGGKFPSKITSAKWQIPLMIYAAIWELGLKRFYGVKRENK